MNKQVRHSSHVTARLGWLVMILAMLFFSRLSMAIEPWARGSAPAPTDDSIISEQQLAQIRSNLAAGKNSVDNLRALQNTIQQTDAKPGNATTTKRQATANALAGSNQDMGSLVAKNKLSTKQLRSQAFSNVVNNALPMTPDQIVKLHALFNNTQQAQATTPGIPSKPVTRMLQVSLSPGATPPVIRLSPGFVTAVSILDATGAPWPIAAYDLGDPAAYNISWNQKNNILMIQSMTIGKRANIVVQLKGLSTPLILTLVSSQQAVDYRVDLRVPELGPNPAALPDATNLPASANTQLLGILNGIPPKGSKALTVSDSFSQAWVSQGKLFLRTQASVLSPGWIASMASGDGTKAYELEKTPMILLNQHGKTVALKITGFD